MSCLKFAANISTMFTDLPFIERYSAAAKCGFRAVECQFMHEEEFEHLKQAKIESGLIHVLMNTPPNSPGLTSYEDEEIFGFASHPQFYIRNLNIFNQCLLYRIHLDVKKIHLLAGMKHKGLTEVEMDDAYINSLKGIVEMCEEHCLMALIEPICKTVKDNYYLSSYKKAIEMIEKINHPNIKLLLDVYHLYEIEGSVDNLEKYYKYCGHIQISQSPDRSEPSRTGNINYEDVFRRLEALNHSDFIGLEYYPTSSTKDSLKWMEEFHLKL